MNGTRIAQRLTRLFSQVITIYPWTGQDAHGGATYATAGTEYRAHIQQAIVRSTGSAQAMPGLYKIIIGDAAKIDPRDKVVLPAEYGTRDDDGEFEAPATKIVEVHYMNDSHGHVATTLVCGKG